MTLNFFGPQLLTGDISNHSPKLSTATVVLSCGTITVCNFLKVAAMSVSSLLFLLAFFAVYYKRVERRIKRICRRVDRALLRVNRFFVKQSRRVLWQ
jgi:hypothetical protein